MFRVSQHPSSEVLKTVTTTSGTVIILVQLLPDQDTLEGRSCRAHLKRYGTHAETRFGLSATRTGTYKLAGRRRSVQSTTGSRGVRINSSNGSHAAGYTMYWGRVQVYWLPTPLACFPFTSPTIKMTYIKVTKYNFILTGTRNRITCNKFMFDMWGTPLKNWSIHSVSTKFHDWH